MLNFSESMPSGRGFNRHCARQAGPHHFFAEARGRRFRRELRRTYGRHAEPTPPMPLTRFPDGVRVVPQSLLPGTPLQGILHTGRSGGSFTDVTLAQTGFAAAAFLFAIGRLMREERKRRQVCEERRPTRGVRVQPHLCHRGARLTVEPNTSATRRICRPVALSNAILPRDAGHAARATSIPSASSFWHSHCRHLITTRPDLQRTSCSSSRKARVETCLPRWKQIIVDTKSARVGGKAQPGAHLAESRARASTTCWKNGGAAGLGSAISLRHRARDRDRCRAILSDARRRRPPPEAADMVCLRVHACTRYPRLRDHYRQTQGSDLTGAAQEKLPGEVLRAYHGRKR